MPSKNIIKTYVKDGFYHIYNRGVEKRIIFIDDQDYRVFLTYLKEALSPPPNPTTRLTEFTLQGRTFKGIPRQPKNFSDKIELMAYCLMPNHFHFLIRQREEQAIKEFMQAIGTRYCGYFNKKNKRVGSLFQGRYKAALVNEESYLLHLSRYIHRNPIDAFRNLTLAYSSYGEYVGIRNTAWIKPGFILSFFGAASGLIRQQTNTYKEFVEFEKINSVDYLEDLLLEDL